MSDEYSSESSSSAEEVPTKTFTTAEYLRAVIYALVLSLRTHCNSSGKYEADTVTGQLEADLEGVLDAEEIEHLDSIFDYLKQSPAPANAFPAPPVPIDQPPDEPSESPSSAEPVETAPVVSQGGVGVWPLDGPHGQVDYAGEQALPSSEPVLSPQRHD